MDKVLTIEQRKKMLKIAKDLGKECEIKGLDCETTKEILLECLKVMAEEYTK